MKAPKYTFLIVVTVTTVIAIWLITWWWIDNHIIPSGSEIALSEFQGQFGDKFGSINSLFSALALAGVIIAIYIQTNELSLQKDELINQRTEFRVNRLTNVLFRVIESINKEIQDSVFYFQSETEAIKNHIDIDKMLWRLRVIGELDDEEKRENALNTILSLNHDKIFHLTQNVHNKFLSFEKTLKKSNLAPHDQDELKSLMKEFLDERIFLLATSKNQVLTHKDLKHPDKDLKIINQQRLRFEQQLSYLNQY